MTRSLRTFFASDFFHLGLFSHRTFFTLDFFHIKVFTIAELFKFNSKISAKISASADSGTRQPLSC